jgi:hypothetical protein
VGALSCGDGGLEVRHPIVAEVSVPELGEVWAEDEDMVNSLRGPAAGASHVNP